MNTITLICLHCGLTKKSDVIADNENCKYQMTGMHTWKPRFPIRVCPACNEEYESQNIHAYKNTFCSVCALDALRKRTRQIT